MKYIQLIQKQEDATNMSRKLLDSKGAEGRGWDLLEEYNSRYGGRPSTYR
jgi:hypothetical protein